MPGRMTTPPAFWDCRSRHRRGPPRPSAAAENLYILVGGAACHQPGMVAGDDNDIFATRGARSARPPPGTAAPARGRPGAGRQRRQRGSRLRTSTSPRSRPGALTTLSSSALELRLAPLLGGPRRLKHVRAAGEQSLTPILKLQSRRVGADLHVGLQRSFREPNPPGALAAMAAASASVSSISRSSGTIRLSRPRRSASTLRRSVRRTRSRWPRLALPSAASATMYQGHQPTSRS
jgi:hypothetical protein